MRSSHSSGATLRESHRVWSHFALRVRSQSNVCMWRSHNAATDIVALCLPYPRGLSVNQATKRLGTLSRDTFRFKVCLAFPSVKTRSDEVHEYRSTLFATFAGPSHEAAAKRLGALSRNCKFRAKVYLALPSVKAHSDEVHRDVLHFVPLVLSRSWLYGRFICLSIYSKKNFVRRVAQTEISVGIFPALMSILPSIVPLFPSRGSSDISKHQMPHRTNPNILYIYMIKISNIMIIFVITSPIHSWSHE